MSPRPLGTLCDLSPYDAPDRDVRPGDCVRTRAGSAYLVLRARRVRSKVPGRWALTCLRIGVDEIPADAVVHPLEWYPRGRR